MLWKRRTTVCVGIEELFVFGFGSKTAHHFFALRPGRIGADVLQRRRGGDAAGQHHAGPVLRLRPAGRDHVVGQPARRPLHHRHQRRAQRLPLRVAQLRLRRNRHQTGRNLQVAQLSPGRFFFDSIAFQKGSCSTFSSCYCLYSLDFWFL